MFEECHDWIRDFSFLVKSHAVCRECGVRPSCSVRALRVLHTVAVEATGWRGKRELIARLIGVLH